MVMVSPFVREPCVLVVNPTVHVVEASSMNELGEKETLLTELLKVIPLLGFAEDISAEVETAKSVLG
jgi:hypothetical protein